MRDLDGHYRLRMLRLHGTAKKISRFGGERIHDLASDVLDAVSVKRFLFSPSALLKCYLISANLMRKRFWSGEVFDLKPTRDGRLKRYSALRAWRLGERLFMQPH